MLPISGFEKRQFNIRYHLALLHYTAIVPTYNLFSGLFMIG